MIATATAGLEPFFHWIVQQFNPALTVELGVDYGGSIIELARYNKGQVIGIDHFRGDEHSGQRDVEEIARANIAASGLQNISLIVNDFHDAAQHWEKPIDLLFIDGRHNYCDAIQDFYDWFPHVRSGGVILMHDTMSFPNDVGRFFRELELPKFEITYSHGLGVILKP